MTALDRFSSRSRIIVAVGIYLVALCLALWYLLPNVGRYRQLLSLSPAFVLMIILLATHPERGLQNYVLYPRLGARISLFEAQALSYVNTLANQLPFSGGIIAKGVYLKQRHRLPYTRFFGATVGLLALAITVGGLTGLATLAYLSFALGKSVPWILIAGFVVMSLAVIAIWFPVPVRLVPGRWREEFNRLIMSREFLLQHGDLVIRLCLLQLATVLIVSLRLWAAFRLMSQDIPLPYFVLFAAASMLTQLASFAPGGLGVREAIVAATARLVGFDIGISLVAVSIDRVLETAVIFLLGALSSVALGKSFMALRFSEPPDGKK